MAAIKPTQSLPGKTGDQPDLRSETLLDRQDLLQLFHISVRTLQNWRTKGILPYSKIRNKIYYRQSDVDEMLQKHRQAG